MTKINRVGIACMLVLGFAVSTAQAQVAWTPSNATVTAWYDAADASTVLTSGSAVTNWLDKSGNNLHLRQGTPANQPTNGAAINSLNALDFTGDEMATASNPFGTTVSNAFVIAVHKVDSIGQGDLFSLTGSDNTANRWQSHAPWSDGTLYFDCGGAGAPNRINASYGVSAGSVVLSSFYCSTTDNVQQVYKNGSLLASDGTGHTVATGGGNIRVGHVSNYQDTTLGELIIINGTVSAATRQKFEGYLAHKWGLTNSLPSNHPYKSTPPLIKLSVTVTAPTAGQVFLEGASVTATVAVEYGATNYQTVAFYTNGVSAWSTNNTSSTLFTIPLGVLGAGTYTNYAYVLDATNGVAYSSTNTFSVVAPATYYWDTDGSTAGFGNTAGTWGSSAFWSTDSTGASGTANPTITTIDGINFGTASLALGSTASAVGVSGAVTVNSITFGAAQTAPVTLSGGTSITLGGTSPTITVNNASNTISSLLAGSAGMTKAGTGTLTLSGANTLSGTTTINGGVLKLQGNAFMTTPRNYSIASGAVLNLDGSSINKLPGSTSTISGTGTLRLTGGILFGNSSSSGTCNLSLGSGAVIDVQAGARMQNGGWSAFNWSANNARLNVDGQFDIGENPATIDALTGTGTVVKTWDGNTRVLTVGIANGSGTFSGTITNGSGTIALTKTGTGTQTLSGNNSYSGVTAINGGTLAIAHNNALGNTTGNTTIAATGSINGPRLTLSGNVNSPENISLTGNTEQNNWASVIYNTSGTNTLSGTITLSNPAGNIRFSSTSGELIFAGTITQTTSTKTLILQAAPGAPLTVNNAIANNNGPLNILGVYNGGASAGVTLKASSTALGNVNILENGLLKLGVTDAIKTTADLTLGTTASNAGFDVATLDLAGFNQTVNALIGSKSTGGTIAPDTSRIVTNSAASGTSILTVGNGNGSSIFNGVILDGATAKVALTKVGTGMLTLAANCSYSGDTIVTNGILRTTSTNCLSSLTRVKLTLPGSIDLNFTGTNMIKALYINGVQQATGTSFGANGSTITGTGFLRTGPPDATLISFF
jgi:fibronectin-binding autotransporter adhesin